MLRSGGRTVSSDFSDFFLKQDSSFPMTAFVWTVENNSEEEYDISITFTFKVGCSGNKIFVTSPTLSRYGGAGIQYWSLSN